MKIILNAIYETMFDLQILWCNIILGHKDEDDNLPPEDRRMTRK